ncbi:hypothetical protein JAAARDRAFT_62179 [Jaapia argillacea MUCL 33604]|uniref:Uncharacterized protein n=1 Tax=Jaapia argillacea MUCL 33604 TaxID=933084 RepID=A0A067PAU1_9AGAM|nr:hypothetical protein JAAARDRAFT_62179 [Jaapia argillacea MUCL 33604]
MHSNTASEEVRNVYLESSGESPEFEETPLDLVEEQRFSSEGVAFPEVQAEGLEVVSERTSSSKLTTSDKLSDLPPKPTPPTGRTRLPGRAPRRSFDGQSSPPSFDSPSPGHTPQHIPSSHSDHIQPSRTSEDSTGKDKSRPRVSFDSDRAALPLFPGDGQSSNPRVVRPSDTNAKNSGQASLRGVSEALFQQIDQTRHKGDVDTPASGSQSNSRAVSPLRLFSWPNLRRVYSREDPFIPVDPFRLRSRLTSLTRHARNHHASDDSFDCDCTNTVIFCIPLPCTTNPDSTFSTYLSATTFFLFDTIPRQLYLNLLLRLPKLYFSRVARIFEDAEVSRPDIQRMIDAGCGRRDNPDGSAPEARRGRGTGVYGQGVTLPFPEEWNPQTVSPALVRFKNSWEEFIASLLREWKTLNIVSALLLSAILTMFQVPAAADDPVIRTPALISLVCALMSLSYGCMFIVRFGSMRSMYRASRWAEEARRTNTAIWWNVWVMLAMPAIWLAWSMVTFITCILSFVWRTGSTTDPPDQNGLPPTQALGPRITITAFFLLGLVYFWLIIQTFRSYGRSIVDPQTAPPDPENVFEEPRGTRQRGVVRSEPKRDENVEGIDRGRRRARPGLALGAQAHDGGIIPSSQEDQEEKNEKEGARETIQLAENNHDFRPL